MGWPQCNTTLEDERLTETPIWHGYDFHQLIEGLSAVTGAVAIIVSLALMFLHTTHYSRPTEQRHIIRVLFMVPVYAAVSFLSIKYYLHSVYYEVLRDCYEAFAIASFFSLMCAYIADDLHAQKEYFRQIKPVPWILPINWFAKCFGGESGPFRTPRSGLTWFNVIWVAVFQYCFIRVAMTIVAVVTQYFDRYCLESLSPAFSHIWVMVIEGVAVSITMYCLIQFYVQIRKDIAQHNPVMKVIAIKLVIFLSFWQTILISFLTSAGAIKASDTIQTPDVKVGIPAMLLCVEMALFSIFHLFSFSYRPYVIGSKAFNTTYGHMYQNIPPKYKGGPLGIKAVFDCFNPWDMIKAIARSAKWLFVGRKSRMQDVSYNQVTQAQRMDDLNASTSYGGAVKPNTPRPLRDELGAGLLASAQQPAGVALVKDSRDSDSDSDSPWQEVEAKEYMQDQHMKQHQAKREDFQTANTYQAYQPSTYHPSPYDAAYHETSLPAQETGVARPAGQGSDTAARRPMLPMVTRQDINDLDRVHGQPAYRPNPYRQAEAKPPDQNFPGGYL